MISGSHLYDFSQCPHRVYLDVHGDPAERDEPNPFVQMLWEHGNVHEDTIVAEAFGRRSLRAGCRYTGAGNAGHHKETPSQNTKTQLVVLKPNPLFFQF